MSTALLEPAEGPAGAAKADGVAVVITTFNHARFLGEAIASVLGQTVAADELIVVDDGSCDDPGSVVAHFSGLRFIRQPNRGLAAARNAGLAVAASAYIAFLDADDLLLPRALELGLAAHRRHPGAAFVYGGHRSTDQTGVPLGPDAYKAIGAAPFEALLRGNLIGMHGAVLFDRQALVSAGGYDTGLARCEDYDVFLRLARRHRIVSYPDTVAVYRFHGANMSNDRGGMLTGALQVLDRHAKGPGGVEAEAAREGRRFWRD
jgi:glycosyltransferase involved in cell wall biosynthesis